MTSCFRIQLEHELWVRQGGFSTGTVPNAQECLPAMIAHYNYCALLQSALDVEWSIAAQFAPHYQW